MEAKKPGFVALQKSIYETLSAEITDAAILDNVEENQSFPYITIGEDDFEDDGNKTHHSDNAYALISVWSRSKGFTEVKNLLTTIIEVLSSGMVQQEGYYIAYVNVNQMETSRESDGITRSGMVRVRFRVNQD